MIDLRRAVLVTGAAALTIVAVALLAISGPDAAGSRPATVASAKKAAAPPWTVISSPDQGTGDNQLHSVSCTSATTCFAVGSEAVGGGTEALIEALAGGSWSVVTSPALTDYSNLYGVSCADANDCVAVGIDETGEGAEALVETLSGGIWSVTTIPSTGPTGSILNSVSCTEASSVVSCNAVGYLDISGQAQPLAMASNGGVWTIVPTPPLDSGYGILNAVSCTSATSCMAVGYLEVSDATESLIESLAGGVWSLSTGASSDSGSVLSGVSCASAADCVAVGNVVNEARITQTLAESWNGTAWSVGTTRDPGNQGNLLIGVSCPSATDCIAAGSSSDGSGNQTLLETWDGTAWSHATSPDPGTTTDYLTAPSCPSIDSCQSVGASTTGADAAQTLVLSFLVPPPVITEVTFNGGLKDPTITVKGSGFGTEPAGASTGCGTTGSDYPGTDLVFQDVTAGWSSGTTGDCVGLVVSQYKPAKVTFTFGDAYDAGHPRIKLHPSDVFTVSVDGATCAGPVPKSGSVLCGAD